MEVSGIMLPEASYVPVRGLCTYELRHEKTCLFGFPTKSNINQAVQPQKMDRGLKFPI